MTADRKTYALPTRSVKSALSALARWKCNILSVFCLMIAVCGGLSPALADGISVNRADAQLSENNYRISATFDVNLTYTAQQALARGIPLYFKGEFLLTRSRWYWLDEEIFKGEQTVKLSYNVLTRQYRISRGALFQNFIRFEDALKILSRQNSPAIPAELMKQNGNYLASVRFRLDIAQLPLPLQVNALTGKDWFLDSDWYRWMIRPEDITSRNESRRE
jgi:hypothetical protein